MEEALNYYHSKGYNAKGYLFDVTNEENAAKFVELITQEVGNIHILVNNAGLLNVNQQYQCPFLILEK
jgi:gluconate 5-dehydrogenase